MLGKLSFRNAKKQAKDYIIYFITVIISVALMFSFNSIAVSKDINELSSIMKSFSQSIIGISIIIILVVAWLINYTMKFMINKRSKEFGVYQILGIERKSISNIFMLENIIIGIVAFIVGVFIGTLLYQIFTSIIMNLFNQPYKIEITFSLKAVGLTAVYFFGIFLITLLSCRKRINKTKVYDFLYADKKNENSIIKKQKGNILLFTLSILLLICALFISNNEFKNSDSIQFKNITTMIVMFIVGTYLFYMGISSFIIKRYLNNKKRKYQKDNMFLYRNLTSKINTMSFSLGTIALIFSIILVGGNIALFSNNLLSNEIELGYPFEIMINSPDDDFSKYEEYIYKNTNVQDLYKYKLYTIGEIGLSKEVFRNTSFEELFDNKYDSILSLTDYNNLRKILGYERINLQDDEILVNCLKTVKKDFDNYIKENNTIKLLGNTVKIKEVREENISQVGFNGFYYAIIVPDNLIPLVENEDNRVRDMIREIEQYDYTDFKYKLVATTKEPTDELFYTRFRNFIINGDENIETNINFGNLQTKGNKINQSNSFYSMISFLSFYVALVFAMTAATLLAIQQLSDSEKYKYEYELLKKLGTSDTQINKTIFKQLLFYFGLPLLIPILISIPVALDIGVIFSIGVTEAEILKNILFMIGIFILIYGIYFLATYIQFSRNIEEH